MGSTREAAASPTPGRMPVAPASVVLSSSGRWHDPTAGGRNMRRREFITLIGGAAGWPIAAQAQQPERMRRIGVLQGLAANDPEGQDRFDALFHALQELDWIDGRNIQIVHRLTGGDIERA